MIGWPNPLFSHSKTGGLLRRRAGRPMRPSTRWSGSRFPFADQRKPLRSLRPTLVTIDCQRGSARKICAITLILETDGLLSRCVRLLMWPLTLPPRISQRLSLCRTLASSFDAAHVRQLSARVGLCLRRRSWFLSKDRPPNTMVLGTCKNGPKRRVS